MPLEHSTVLRWPQPKTWHSLDSTQAWVYTADSDREQGRFCFAHYGRLLQ